MSKMKKGFTLAEMVAVIAIMMILAVLSVPFVRTYIDDAHNGKATIYMRELNEARMNFEKDYPGVKITESGTAIPECNVDDIYGSSGLQVQPNILIACHYMSENLDILSRYDFTLGEPRCEACTKEGVTPVVSMLGNEDAGLYKGKCTCIDSLGNVYRQE